jgi:vacuolar protein sorting-associated protein 13A/C
VLANSIGVALLNIDEAEFTIEGFCLTKIFEAETSLTNKISTHYTQKATRQLIKLIGALDIIGNPYNLFKNVGTGVVELFEKPIEGFVQGPLEGIKGIGKGVGSLAKGIVSGVSNSLSRATSVAASSLASISMDADYVNRRERRITKKPKHVISGLALGITELGMGIVEGGAGIFVNPIKGAIQGGPGGFCKGTLQCSIGIVSKPLTGVLDFASKTAEGIKNTATCWDDKANERRIRPPRVIFRVF